MIVEDIYNLFINNNLNSETLDKIFEIGLQYIDSLYEQLDNDSLENHM